MSDKKFDRKAFRQDIEAAETRIASMRRDADGLPARADGLPARADGLPARRGSGDLFPEAFEELKSTLEELRVAEEELRQQNDEILAAQLLADHHRQRYQALFDFAPDGYLVTDAQGMIREANHRAAEMLKIGEKFLVNKPLVTFVAEDTRTAFRAGLNWLDQAGRTEEWEVQLKPRKGDAFPAALSVVMDRDASGRPATLRWLLRDITARKQAEAERLHLVREQEARIEAEAASSRQAFLADISGALGGTLDDEAMLENVARLAVPTLADWCVVDLRGDDVSPRRSAAAHTAASKRDLLTRMARDYGGGGGGGGDTGSGSGVAQVLRTGQRLFLSEMTDEELVSMAEDDRHADLLRRLGLRSYLILPLTARGRMLGTLSLALAESGRFFDKDGIDLAEEVARRVAVSVDNARLYREARTAEQRSEESLALLETALAGAPSGFAFVDTDFRYRNINPALAEMNGLSVEDHLGRTVAEVVGAGVWAQVEPLLRRALDGETLREQEITTEPAGHPDAVAHVLVSYYPMRVREQIVGVGITLSDITERKQTEKALQVAFEREHRIADVLERVLVVPIPPDAFAGLSVETRYKSALNEARVGGDFYDAFALRNGKIAFVVGDMSGKGLKAATRTAEIKYALRAFLWEDPDASRALARLNDFLCSDGMPADHASDAFTVLSLAVVDPVTGEAVFTVAGAEPPLILRADGTTVMAEAGGALLGYQPGETYETTTLRLNPGDTILLVTDGITEARRGTDFLEYEGMVALAQQALPGTVQEIGRAILEGAEAFTGGQFHDDVCLLLARLEPS